MMNRTDNPAVTNALIEKLRHRFEGNSENPSLNNEEAAELFAAYVKLDRRIARIVRISDNYQAEIRDLVGELQSAMTTLQEVKGYIPVCTSCRKIRNDRGYWKQLEQYLSEQTRGHFTNALCPECGPEQAQTISSQTLERNGERTNDDETVEDSELSDPVVARFLPLFNDQELCKNPLLGELQTLFRKYVSQNRRLERIARISDNYQWELKESNAILNYQNSEMEQFTHSVSHDLKSPLISIIGFADLLHDNLSETGNQEALANLAYIRSAASKMRSLIDSLRNLARAGRLTNPNLRVDFTTITEEALDAVRGLVTEKKITVQVADNLPEAIGDPVWLRQVLQNLLENAAKYMGGQPQPLIEVGFAETARGNALFIRDNGQGVDLADQESVFGLFKRASEDGEGSGIGLAMVKRIVEIHGGRVWLESKGSGQGTTVWVMLPWENKVR